jgi:DNA-binding winged helix-turn-helix (wHTH) protein
MQHDRVPKHCELISADDWDFFCEADNHERRVDAVMIRPPTCYHQAYGDEPIRVGIVEFRMMHLLASRPYYAFTRYQIADAVHTESHPLAKEAVDAYIASLRNQLADFHNFVQSVRYLGYCFKAYVKFRLAPIMDDGVYLHKQQQRQADAN